jgi:hypothetical protein
VTLPSLYCHCQSAAWVRSPPEPFGEPCLPDAVTKARRGSCQVVATAQQGTAALELIPFRQVCLDEGPLRALPERLGADRHHGGLYCLGAAPPHDQLAAQGIERVHQSLLDAGPGPEVQVLGR